MYGFVLLYRTIRHVSISIIPSTCLAGLNRLPRSSQRRFLQHFLLIRSAPEKVDIKLKLIFKLLLSAHNRTFPTTLLRTKPTVASLMSSQCTPAITEFQDSRRFDIFIKSIMPSDKTCLENSTYTNYEFVTQI